MDEQILVSEDNVTPFPTTGRSNGGSRNGSAGRLTLIEKRVENLEKTVQETRDLCIEMKTRMENLTTKEYVIKHTLYVVSICILTLLGHVAMRFLIPS